MPERDSSADALRLGRLVAERLGHRRPSSRTSAPRSRGSAATRARTRPSAPSSPSTARAGSARSPCRRSSTATASTSSASRCERRPASSGPRACRRRAYLQLVAATNFKQRVAQDDRVLPRRSPELRGRRHAEPARVRPGLLREAGRRRGRREADRAPLQDAGLRARRHLGVPEEIQRRPPTTDTFSMAQTQEEFYFALPYDRMDLCL